MPEGQVLEFSGVTKQFGAVTAVSGFSARVEPGRVTGFLGPNGAGKTTTLRILLGLVRATGGTATIGGVPYASLKQPLQTVGAVLEASSFHPGRSAANHLKVYAQAAGLPLARVDETLALVGLGDVGGRKVGGFSLGMRQRLGLAYALLGDPGVLVLDEPANGLDPEGIKWMRGFLRRLAREGRTVFVSSHLLAEVQQTVDSVLIISQGRLVFHGTLEDLTDPSEFSTVVDAPDRAALSAALKAADAPFELLRSGLTVPGLDPAAVGRLAASAGVALSTLQRRGPALEEVFLDLVSGVRVHPTGAPVAAAGGVASLSPVQGTDAATDAAGAQSVAEPETTVEDAGTAAAALDADGTPGAAAAGLAAVAAAAGAREAEPDDAPVDGPPVDPDPASAAAATFTVASTGVIDIVSAGDPATDAYGDGLPLDADPDVEALGAIDAELSGDEPAGDVDSANVGAADEVYDTTAAVESGELASEGADIEVASNDADEEPADDDRPWAQYVKTEADVEADAFFAAFTAEREEQAAQEASDAAAASADGAQAQSEGGAESQPGSEQTEQSESERVPEPDSDPVPESEPERGPEPSGHPESEASDDEHTDDEGSEQR